jgi:acyl carrier protein
MEEEKMNHAEIERVVREYIQNEFLPDEDPSALDGSTPLISSGILDSIATAKLVSFVESRFGVRFKASEIGVQRMDTIDLIVATTESKLAG